MSNSIAEYFGLRRSIYLTLALPFYREPDNEYLAKLKKYIPVLTELGAESVEMRGVVEALEKSLDNAVPETLAGIFAGLFLGVNKATHSGHTVTPHESVYLSDNGLVMQEPWDEVREIFYREGVAKDSGFMEPEDHFSSEMGFIAHLSGKTSELLAGGDTAAAAEAVNAQMDFMDKHLLRWADRLVADIEISTGDAFYKALSGTAVNYIKADRVFLSEYAQEQ